MKLLRSFLLSSGAVLVFLAACSDDTTTTKGGIALTVATDGTVQPDRLSLKVTSGTTTFLGVDLAIGTGALPKTIDVDATGTATIVVKAWQNGNPVDRRDLVVGPLPVDHHAPYTVLLSAKCSGHVHADSGDIVSDCAGGTTCNPGDGTCGSTTVTLPSGDAGTVCAAGSTSCADGTSLRTCKSDGSGYDAPISCNGKTCVGNACTQCNVGDESCGSTPPKCTQGALRCSGTNNLDSETCQADGTWRHIATCPFLCSNGNCVGECGPGSTQCCIKYDDGSEECGNEKKTYQACINGRDNCGNHDANLKQATAVVVRTCGTNAMYGETSSCATNCVTGGTALRVACGYCGSQPAACLPTCLCQGN